VNISNSGKPTPAEWREKLFSKFMWMGDDPNGSTLGMGLGLSFVKKILGKHGGDIQYEAKGNGSNFLFTLPIIVGERGV